ncbi:hypothetical protein PT974_10778 [Cladobotryum mycophilum]|uniref:Uncharacterized protein n=1 Tax=Cladobotryum mycophilum TaxID=491253 RepID=A0ABR0SAV5_9HYPO
MPYSSFLKLQTHRRWEVAKPRAVAAQGRQPRPDMALTNTEAHALEVLHIEKGLGFNIGEDPVWISRESVARMDEDTRDWARRMCMTETYILILMDEGERGMDRKNSIKAILESSRKLKINGREN